jgi:hypothetical protein
MSIPVKDDIMARKRPRRPENEVSVEVGGHLQSLDAAWADFRTQHASWIAKFPPGEPIYSLPELAIESLARPRSSKIAALLTVSEVAAETIFTELCEQMRYLGIVDGRGIMFDLLVSASRLPLLDDATLAKLG